MKKFKTADTLSTMITKRYYDYKALFYYHDSTLLNYEFIHNNEIPTTTI